jgi:hypothetical protein
LPLDNVHFTVTAPAAVRPGESFMLQFWAHLQTDLARILDLSRLTLRTTDLFYASEGPFLLERGTRITVELKIAELEIASMHKEVFWRGETGCANFVVTVPRNAALGARTGIAHIRVNGALIAKQEFILNIQASQREVVPISTRFTLHKRGFASYATEDRAAVLARVQGIQKALPSLAVFVDVIQLRSGQFWQQELWREIAECDVLYLFWCRHARLSPWVEKEWRYALETRGLDFIDPIPLEDPRDAAPPIELAARHFNDPLLAYMTVEPAGLHEKALGAS